MRFNTPTSEPDATGVSNAEAPSSFCVCRAPYLIENFRCSECGLSVIPAREAVITLREVEQGMGAGLRFFLRSGVEIVRSR